MRPNKKTTKEKSGESEERNLKEEFVDDDSKKEGDVSEEEDIAEEDRKLDIEHDESGIWNTETEAAFFLAADKYPPSGAVYPLQCFNLRMVCGECVHLDESKDGKSRRCLTSKESLEHALKYWNTRIEPETIPVKDIIERSNAHHLPHYVLPKEYRTVILEEDYSQESHSSSPPPQKKKK